ncbi:uncharacterized protein LOC143244342 isoform X2 [Tachypleus tridentatus]|uniref:uncharacterized protein LOC143244342 isoform X2 n=1 Tax=Tachypleus tridentatus TaxID=6853 RepID=UPI003FD36126
MLSVIQSSCEWKIVESVKYLDSHLKFTCMRDCSNFACFVGQNFLSQVISPVSKLLCSVSNIFNPAQSLYSEPLNLSTRKLQVLSRNPVEQMAKTHVDRKFYDISNFFLEKRRKRNEDLKEKTEPINLLKYIYDNVIGNNSLFSGPYGVREVVYCDYTASGKPLHFIEDFILHEVLPLYGNTHTSTSVTSLQTTLFRHESRDIIRQSVNAGEQDAVIFVGNGCTAAVHKIISALNLKESPTVFLGPYEHHSNLLPWREIGAEVIRIKEDSGGYIDLNHLEHELKKHQEDGKLLIGSFAAASNVTGILSDVNTISSLLHKHGALAFWDYAASAPYVDIDMNPVVSGLHEGLVYKDAIFISPHKFVGGPDTPGILVAKRDLFTNPVPSGCGGGTVFFVTRETHRYLQEVEMREEGGTPSIVGTIRAGLAFQLKDSVTTEVIMQRENEICRKALGVWNSVPELIILGSLTAFRLPIFSFVVQHIASGLFLHHNFVSALLNDLFGIQVRGGCACAGPYAEDLLGIDEKMAIHIETLLAEDKTLDRLNLRRYKEYSEREILRPGFVRLNFPYFMPDEEVDFITEALQLVAKEGWKLLPQYIFNPETGEWKHHYHQVFKERKWLGSISYNEGRMSYVKSQDVPKELPPQSKKECLEKAREEIDKASKVAYRIELPEQELMFDKEAANIRWLLLPSEAKSYMLGEKKEAVIKKSLPFYPKTYTMNFNNVASSSNNFFRNKGDHLCEVESLNIETGISISKREQSLKVISSSLSLPNKTKDKQLLLPEPVIHALESHENNMSSKWISESSCKYKTECYTLDHNSVSSKLHCCIEMSNHGAKSENVLEKHRELKNQLQATTCQWHSPPKQIFKPFLKGVEEFNMIQDGDNVLVCLSGGKDSLSLLHTLHQYQFYAKKKEINFHLGAVTVDPGSSSYDPRPLKGYLHALGVPYLYEEQGIVEQASQLPECSSICSFCSRMKRGRIYACARREGYNVIALGQHLDDLAESFLMSVFHNGYLRTMKAHYTVKEKDLRVIRPLVYVREKNLRKFAEQRKLPVIPENCPACFEAPKERHRTKQLLAAQEILFPKLYASLRSAMHPLMSINKTGIDRKVFSWVSQYNDGDDDEF